MSRHHTPAKQVHIIIPLLPCSCSPGVEYGKCHSSTMKSKPSDNREVVVAPASHVTLCSTFQYATGRSGCITKGESHIVAQAAKPLLLPGGLINVMTTLVQELISTLCPRENVYPLVKTLYLLSIQEIFFTLCPRAYDSVLNIGLKIAAQERHFRCFN